MESYRCYITLVVSMWDAKTGLTICPSVLRNEVDIPGVYQMVQIKECAVKELH
jgi:hypothetical protein